MEPRPRRGPRSMRDFESLVEQRIREAQERGEFDDLPGAGKPIPDIDAPHDELWSGPGSDMTELSVEEILARRRTLRERG